MLAAALVALGLMLPAAAASAAATTDPAARAAATTVPADTIVTFATGTTTCGQVSIDGDRNATGGAYTDAAILSDSCGIGVEGAIESPDGTYYSYGGDVKQPGDHSVTGVIPTNSGNYHGMRAWINGSWYYCWWVSTPAACALP
jgi:hypothetical protein